MDSDLQACNKEKSEGKDGQHMNYLSSPEMQQMNHQLFQ
jgi:hypothetical protein